MKITASDLRMGLDLFKATMDRKHPYVVPNVIELEFPSLSNNSKAIHAALEYIRSTGPGTSIFQVKEDNVTDTLNIQVSASPVQKILSTYTNLVGTKLFDGRHTTKEIVCSTPEFAKEVMDIVLVLCNFGLYGGYSYDYGTNRLTVF